MFSLSKEELEIKQAKCKDVDKNDANMFRGLAILSMLILHLFCRFGDDVYGTPLLWLNEKEPFVYWFGFFAEICVSLYSIQGGYGVYVSGQNGKLDFKSRAKRCLKLLEIYWIVDLLFCGIGLLFDKSGQIPGSVSEFVKSLFLLRSYNGAWWYLTTYLIIILFFSPVLYKLSLKTNFWVGMGACGILQVLFYFIGRFDLIPELNSEHLIVEWAYTQFVNLYGPLVIFFAGCLMCRYRIIAKIRLLFNKLVTTKYQKLLLLVLFVFDFLAVNLIHKAVLTFFNALVVFVLFHLWEKGKVASCIFNFLGRHSTVMWLTHMFFYLYLFEGLVQKARYPVFMLIFMLVLTVASSYVVELVLLIKNKVWSLIKSIYSVCI